MQKIRDLYCLALKAGEWISSPPGHARVPIARWWGNARPVAFPATYRGADATTHQVDPEAREVPIEVRGELRVLSRTCAGGIAMKGTDFLRQQVGHPRLALEARAVAGRARFRQVASRRNSLTVRSSSKWADAPCPSPSVRPAISGWSEGPHRDGARAPASGEPSVAAFAQLPLP